MISTVLETLAAFVILVISTLSYGGIVLTMAIESALIPLPSEIIMPFSGFLASQGKFVLFFSYPYETGTTWIKISPTYTNYWRRLNRAK